MDTDATFEEVSPQNAQDGSKRPLEDNEVHDPETGKRWQLRGFWQSPVLDQKDLLEMLEDWGYTAGDCIQAEVVDNGKNGDGLWLCFYPCARGGSPETDPDKFGTNNSRTAPASLFSIRLTPTQARVLGTALMSAAEIRDAQGEEKNK